MHAYTQSFGVGGVGSKATIYPRARPFPMPHLVTCPTANLAMNAGTSKVYNNITVYVPAGATDYFPLMFKRTTSAQLVRNMRQLKHGYFTVVQTEPPQQLALSDLKGKQGVKVKFIEDVELRDGLQLAVVLDRVSYYPTARQLERTKYVEDQVRLLTVAG